MKKNLIFFISGILISFSIFPLNCLVPRFINRLQNYYLSVTERCMRFNAMWWKAKFSLIRLSNIICLAEGCVETRKDWNRPNFSISPVFSICYRFLFYLFILFEFIIFIAFYRATLWNSLFGYLFEISSEILIVFLSPRLFSIAALCYQNPYLSLFT